MKLKRAIGIDLGTTNSAAAMMSPTGDEVVLLEDHFKRKTFPSVVAWDDIQNRQVVGWDAWNRRGLTPSPITSIKRKMGQTNTVACGPDNLTPEAVSAAVLDHLATLGQPFFQEAADVETLDITQAVITVPAYFDAPQIEATRRAGEIAGIEVIGLLQEPTAACMYFAWRNGVTDGTFLVYDLGGGTFDVSVIRAIDGEYQVLSIDGDNFLGGDDFDRRLAEHFWGHLAEQGYEMGELDTSDNECALRFLLLRKFAQEAKEALSSSPTTYVARRDIFVDQKGESVTLELELSRETFENLITDLVDQTITACRSALAKSEEAAKVGLSEIEYVLLVGGSTRVPLVQTAVSGAFCAGDSKSEAPLSESPDTCVALGAAVHAANLAGLEYDHDEWRIVLTSALFTHQESIRLVGRVTASPTLESAVLLDDAGVQGVSRLKPHDEGWSTFAIDDIELGHIGAHTFELEICDADGDAIHAQTIVFRRGSPDELRPTGSALSNPSVLAKPIYLDVVRDGKSDRALLVAEGTGLPAKEVFRFRTADQSGAVVLRLLQNRFPIRTIHLAIPRDTAVGTSVDLDLRIDESMAIVASGEVAGQKFWAQVEPPPPRQLKDWEAIEVLLDQVDDIRRRIWGQETRVFEEATTPLVQGIRESARTDQDRLHALVARLEDVLERYQTTDGELTPAWSRAESLLDAIRRLVYRDDNRRLGLNADEWHTRLGELQTTAREAYDAHDQEAWSRAFDRIQATWESLAQDEYRFRSGSDPVEHLERLVALLRRECDELAARVEDFDYSDNPETRTLQENEVAAIRKELHAKVAAPLAGLDVEGAPPAHVKPQLDRMFETYEFLEKRLERVPTIGLVSR